jgi:group I intron endonuclease
MKGIYKITNLKNGKVYIGQSDRLNQREREHFYRLENLTHSNEHLQRSYNKYGKDNFIFEIIEETTDLDNREIHFINEYGGINSKLNYNLKDPLTKEWANYTRVKQSKLMTGENNPNFGINWTQEQKNKLSEERKGVTLEERIGKDKADLAKAKMSKSQTGRKHPDDVKEKIRKANEGENNPAYGMGDRQRGDNNPMWGKISENRKPVQQYTKEGVLVKEYDYLSQVSEDGFNIGNVGSVCNGKPKYKSSGGFVWKFKEDLDGGSY